jgi:hypothetical protein
MTDDLVLHHSRVRNDPPGAAVREKRSLEGESYRMLAIKKPAKFLERTRELVPPFEPGTMNSVTGAVNIAPPDSLEAEQDIALLARHSLDFAGERSGRAPTDPSDRAEGPLVSRPFRSGKEQHPVTHGCHACA